MTEHEKWQWQEPGTAWKGAGMYHITMTVGSRRPLLGTLEVPENDPTRTWVRRTPLGNALVDCLLSVQSHHQEVQVLHFCVMPDHLHAVLYVRRRMETGIRSVVRGFWQAAKKLGRAATVASSSFVPNDIRQNCQEGTAAGTTAAAGTGAAAAGTGAAAAGTGTAAAAGLAPGAGAIPSAARIEGLQEATLRLEAFSEGLRATLGEEAYYSVEAVFTEKPFIRPMGQRTQLPTTVRYIDMNPQRLATKRLRPGFFRVQRGIVVGGRSYDGVGNALLLTGIRYQPVHVRHWMVKEAENGRRDALRNYMNGCVLAARRGTVMVSPFISPHEKQVMDVLLREQRPFICLADNGFGEYYKPTDTLFDACAAGRVLLLSPWPYDAGKRHISRQECVALNTMAEEICNELNNPDYDY